MSPTTCITLRLDDSLHVLNDGFEVDAVGARKFLVIGPTGVLVEPFFTGKVPIPLCLLDVLTGKVTQEKRFVDVVGDASVEVLEDGHDEPAFRC